MKDVKGYTYESALKEEKELEEKIRAELDSLGKPELMAVVKDYAVVVAMRLTIGTFEGK
jgi:hypothetical protein